MKEQRMKQEREINQLRETMGLEKEEQDRQWERKQKEHEFEVDQLKERARLEYVEMVKEQGMKQEREINQLKETTRLEKEEAANATNPNPELQTQNSSCGILFLKKQGP